YVFSSTYVDKHSNIQQTWVLPASPMAFLELGKNEIVQLRSSPATRTYYGKKFRLSQQWLKSDGEPKTPIWILNYDKDVTKNTILLGRALRLYIMRLHAEFACLRNLMR